jgi:hypothetical protein
MCRKRHAASLMPDNPKDALAVLDYSRRLVEEFLTTEITPEAAGRSQSETERRWFGGGRHD